MKIIDLLNRIANKENDKLPKKIEFRDEIYYLEEDEYMYYKTKNNNELMEELLSTWDLVSEVEIIEEEKEIEKLELGVVSPNNEYIISVHDEKIQDKINEIIDVINDMRDKEC